MKRTAPRLQKLEGEQWTAGELITCEVTGEMDTGTKVWTELKTGEQFFLFRLLGKYYFCHM